IYMQAVVAVSGSGGWPMSVFLTPDLKPFYGGTYFPPEDRGGMPSFRRVLQSTEGAYRQRNNEVVASADQLVEHLKQSSAFQGDQEPLTRDVMDTAFKRLSPNIDTEWGGFGTSIKFPQPMVQEFLLRYGASTAEPTAQAMVDLTLDKMMRGGIYDHIGGGFHRYSVDRMWLVPHFEKMLYDNALLIRLYLHSYQVLGRPEYRRVVEETADYVLRDMRDPSGGFYTALDADSEGEEGIFYTWKRLELIEILGPEAGELFCKVYGVTEEGNFEGQSILYLPQELSKTAEELGMDGDELVKQLAASKTKLLNERSKRVWPLRDEKVLTGWNALILGSLAEAASVLGRPEYLTVASANATFLLESLRDADGRLLRTYRDGKAKLKGYLEDYAFLADGLLTLYEATFDSKWLWEAKKLADAMLELFWDADSESFFNTGHDHEELLVRPQEFFDNALPSGASAATLLLLRLGALFGTPKYTEVAQISMRSMRSTIMAQPMGYGHWLCGLDFALSTPKEVVVVGNRTETNTVALLNAVYSRFLPNKVVAGMETEDDPIADQLGLLEGRVLINGLPTAYVCQNYTCQMPVTDPRELLEQLDPASDGMNIASQSGYLEPPKWKLNPISEAGE
ncbi:MAG: thioredoxin domain-containing protein, partial [Chloroflexota bacterium]|nr:thioredoxin domain-containing protein [Chloroflexota bacterium]